MRKILYFKQQLDIGKCNTPPIESPYEIRIKNPFINTSYIDRIVYNFFKEQIKDAMKNQIKRFGFTLHDAHLHFANCVDEHTRKLAGEAYNEVLNEFWINK